MRHITCCYQLGTNVSISQLLWKSGNTSICAESKHICTHMFRKSYLSHHWQFVDAQDTNEHTSACSCPYISLTLVDIQDTIEHICLCHGYCYYCLFSMKWMPGHEWAHQCLPVSWASLFLPVWDPMNAQGTSEHTGARLCPVCYYSFDSVRVPGTWSGCPVYDLYVFVIAPSTFCGCTGHEWVYWCSCMSCMSVYYYPWHCECPEHEWALLAYVVGILNSISLTHMYIYIYCNNIVIDIK